MFQKNHSKYFSNHAKVPEKLLKNMPKWCLFWWVEKTGAPFAEKIKRTRLCKIKAKTLKFRRKWGKIELITRFESVIYALPSKCATYCATSAWRILFNFTYMLAHVLKEHSIPVFLYVHILTKHIGYPLHSFNIVILSNSISFMQFCSIVLSVISVSCNSI